MSFLAQIRGGLANAQHEVSRHVNAASIHRAIENAQNSIHMGSTALQSSYLRSIATGLGNQAEVEKQGNCDSATPSPAEAARDNCPPVETRMDRVEDASMKETTGNAVMNDDIIGECSSINTARRDIAEAVEPTCKKPATITCSDRGTCTCKCTCHDGTQSPPNFMDGAQAAAQRLGKTAWENPLLTAATVATGTGLLVVAAPAIVTAPIMGLAGAVGFTPAGIAASSAASAMQASIGNVAVGSIFATLQSAAAGGYGAAVLTGAAQTAGGAAAGAGGLGGFMAYLYGKGKPQPEATDEKKNE